MTRPAPDAPATGGRLPDAAVVAPGTGGLPSDDGSLWESFLGRCRALVEDVRRPDQGPPLRVFAALAALLVFCYWPGLLHAKASWNNPQYSHGWLVPLFSAAMLFWWRRPNPPVTLSARLAGLGLLVASLALRLLVARYRIITIDMYTFVPALAGVALMALGWGGFRWAAAPIGFLIFMFPLPDEATRYLLGPLQTIATMFSTYAIQTVGIDAIRDGNRIVVGEHLLGVVDACSGLRMLTIFIALSVAIVMLGRMNWYENLVILASAVPIALAVNAIRITATGIMYTFEPELAEKIFHDWAGYFMMPAALGLLFLVRSTVSALVVEDDARLATVVAAGPLPASGGLPGRAPRAVANNAGFARPLGIRPEGLPGTRARDRTANSDAKPM